MISQIKASFLNFLDDQGGRAHHHDISLLATWLRLSSKGSPLEVPANLFETIVSDLNPNAILGPTSSDYGATAVVKRSCVQSNVDNVTRVREGKYGDKG